MPLRIYTKGDNLKPSYIHGLTGKISSYEYVWCESSLMEDHAYIFSSQWLCWHCFLIYVFISQCWNVKSETSKYTVMFYINLKLQCQDPRLVMTWWWRWPWQTNVSRFIICPSSLCYRGLVIIDLADRHNNMEQFKYLFWFEIFSCKRCNYGRR